jgi:large subunit ribosomal protein L15
VDHVTPDVLAGARLVKSKDRLIKILGDGEISKPLIVQAHRFSKTAMEKIQAAGGRAELIG